MKRPSPATHRSVHAYPQHILLIRSEIEKKNENIDGDDTHTTLRRVEINEKFSGIQVQDPLNSTEQFLFSYCKQLITLKGTNSYWEKNHVISAMHAREHSMRTFHESIP